VETRYCCLLRGAWGKTSSRATSPWQSAISNQQPGLQAPGSSAQPGCQAVLGTGTTRHRMRLANRAPHSLPLPVHVVRPPAAATYHLALWSPGGWTWFSVFCFWLLVLVRGSGHHFLCMIHVQRILGTHRPTTHRRKAQRPNAVVKKCHPNSCRRPDHGPLLSE
jgi:hypothetical protein